MGVHFHFFKHFILKFAEAQFTRYTFSWKMVDTVNVTRQMERNANLGISDFYLVEDQEGKVNYTGTKGRYLEVGARRAPRLLVNLY